MFNKLRKQNVQKANYLQREKNFLNTITAEDTFQVIVGNDGSNTLLLWQDEYYMEEYLTRCEKPIILSKVNTVFFLKWIKDNHQEMNFVIHPVFGQESLTLNQRSLTEKIIEKIESDGDFYVTLKDNNLL